MPVLAASEARANLYRLIDQTGESHQPIHIAGKRGSALLLSEEDWQSILEPLYLLAVPGMRESIQEGMAEPLENSAIPRGSRVSGEAGAIHTKLYRLMAAVSRSRRCPSARASASNWSQSSGG